MPPNITPRKVRPRQQNNPSHPPPAAIQPSDYDSEAFYEPNVPNRSNTELNLSVLRRYRPSIHTILSIAPSAQTYIYSATSPWIKTDTEGTLFVCQLLPSSVGAPVNYSIVVLNRKGLENLIVDLDTVENVEVQDDFLMVSIKGEGDQGGKTFGFFIHADKSDTREVNCQLVKEKWEEVQGSNTGQDVQRSAQGG
jgi:hypothetical protein